jgi:hypothetical protein
MATAKETSLSKLNSTVSSTILQIYDDINKCIKTVSQPIINNFQFAGSSIQNELYVLTSGKPVYSDEYRSLVQRQGDILVGFIALKPVKSQLLVGSIIVERFEMEKDSFRYTIYNKCVLPLIPLQYSGVYINMLEGNSDDVICVYATVNHEMRRVLVQTNGYLDISTDKKLLYCSGNYHGYIEQFKEDCENYIRIPTCPY